MKEKIASIVAEGDARVKRFETMTSYQNKEITDYKLQTTNLGKEIKLLNSQISDLTSQLSKAESEIIKLKYDKNTNI
jgi:uncharacterized coiled-coil protein SlyX